MAEPKTKDIIRKVLKKLPDDATPEQFNALLAAELAAAGMEIPEAMKPAAPPTGVDPAEYRRHFAKVAEDNPSLRNNRQAWAAAAVRSLVDARRAELRARVAAGASPKASPTNKLTPKQRQLFKHFSSTGLHSKERALELAKEHG